MQLAKLLIFASGSKDGGGSGFEKLVEASRTGRLDANIVGVVSNHEEGGVFARARTLGIPFFHFPGPWSADEYQRIAHHTEADYFALSGWLKLVTGLDLNTRFNPRTVFNIHPGPLPEFGGPGLYGHHVHEAVLKAGWKTSCACMHFVTDGYDRGPIFMQRWVSVKPSDNADTLAKRVNMTEHLYQAATTSLVVKGFITWDGIDPKSLRVPQDYPVSCVSSAS